MSFSDFISIFAMSFRVLFVIFCNTKISEISDMTKKTEQIISAQALIKILNYSVGEIRIDKNVWVY